MSGTRVGHWKDPRRPEASPGKAGASGEPRTLGPRPRPSHRHGSARRNRGDAARARSPSGTGGGRWRPLRTRAPGSLGRRPAPRRPPAPRATHPVRRRPPFPASTAGGRAGAPGHATSAPLKPLTCGGPRFAPWPPHAAAPPGTAAPSAPATSGEGPPHAALTGPSHRHHRCRHCGSHPPLARPFPGPLPALSRRSHPHPLPLGLPTVGTVLAYRLPLDQSESSLLEAPPLPSGGRGYRLRSGPPLPPPLTLSVLGRPLASLLSSLRLPVPCLPTQSDLSLLWLSLSWFP